MVFIERVHITQIDTNDHTVMYSTDMRATLQALLAKKYVGKCFKRCYIIDIVEVLAYSPPVMEAERNGGSARITVQFRVRGLVYDRYEVIPDAKIVEVTEDGKLIMRSKYASIFVAANPKLQAFRVGMTVPVRAYECGYVPYRDTISVTAIPFVPLTETFAFDVSLADYESVEPQLKQITELEKQFKACADSAKWAAFLDPKTVKQEGFKQVELTKVRGTGQIARPEWMPLGSTDVFWREVKGGKEIKNGLTVVRGFLNSTIKQLETAIALATQYEWDAEHKGAWVALYMGEKK